MNASVYILDDQDVSTILTALDTLKQKSEIIIASVREKLESPVKSGSESPATSDPDNKPVNVNTNATTPTNDTPLTPEDVRFKGYPCEVIKKCEDVWDTFPGVPFYKSLDRIRPMLGSRCPGDTTLRRWHKQWKKATENAKALRDAIEGNSSETPNSSAGPVVRKRRVCR